MKQCSKCKKIKEEIYFCPDKRLLDGLQSQCKECQTQYTQSERGKASIKRFRIKERKIIERYGIGLGTLQRYGLKIGLAVYDNFDRKCVKCGSENDLTIHHLDNNGRNNEEKGLKANNNLENLILICRRCHGSIHGKQGGGRPPKK